MSKLLNKFNKTRFNLGRRLAGVELQPLTETTAARSFCTHTHTHINLLYTQLSAQFVLPITLLVQVEGK